MRLAVSADTKNGLDSVISPHYGRCPHLILVDLDDQDVSGVREVDNPCCGQHQPGQVPGLISNLGAMLPHWIEHNAQHAADFRVWAGLAGEAKADMGQMEAANKALMAALTELGGSMGNHKHHHQHDS